MERREWTIKELAAHFNCHTNLIHKWIHSGKIKGYRLGDNGPWRVSWSEVERVKHEWRLKPDLDKAL